MTEIAWFDFDNMNMMLPVFLLLTENQVLNINVLELIRTSLPRRVSACDLLAFNVVGTVDVDIC
jgi:hypothetical protein